MKQYYELLKSSPLFSGFSEEEFVQMLQCLGAQTKEYNKEEIVLLMGEAVTQVGIVLSGTAHIIREDYAGNRMIIEELGAADMFGEVFAFAEVDHSPVTVLAVSKSKVLFLDFKRMITTCPSACAFHARLIKNMLKLIAEKNLRLNYKITLLSRKTTREKLIFYFLSQISKAKGKKITIPFNRNELADYLCVDRSAMSREICKMRDQGIISFRKNEFQLLDLSKMKMEAGEE